MPPEADRRPAELGPRGRGRAVASVERASREPVLVVPTGDDAALVRARAVRGRRALARDLDPHLRLALRGRRIGARARCRPRCSPRPQRLALVRAAIADDRLERLAPLGHVAPGSRPALDTLIGELQAALVTPVELASAPPSSTTALTRRSSPPSTRAYAELRDASGRSDRGALAAARARRAARRAGGRGRGRPVFLYGFDDLTLGAARAGRRAGGDRRRDGRGQLRRPPLAGRAGELRRRAARGARAPEIECELDPDTAYTPRRLPAPPRLAPCSSPTPGTVAPRRRRAAARVRGRARRGRGDRRSRSRACSPAAPSRTRSRSSFAARPAPATCWPSVSARLRDPGRARGTVRRVDRTAVGGPLISLVPRRLRRGQRRGPARPPARATRRSGAGAADRVEERIRRGEVISAGERRRAMGAPASATWRASARRPTTRPRLRALAADRARRSPSPPIASRRRWRPRRQRRSGDAAPVELRAAVAAAELLCASSPPSAAFPTARSLGSATRSRRSRAPRSRPGGARPRAASGSSARTGSAPAGRATSSSPRSSEGEFPAAAPPDPLLGDDRRARARDRRRWRDAISRRGALPVPRLRLAPHRAALPLVAQLRRRGHRAGALAVHRRGARPDRRSPGPTEEALTRHTRPRARSSPRRPSAERARARPRARGARPGRGPRGCARGRRGRRSHSRCRPRPLRAHATPTRLPGPLRVPRVLAALRERDGAERGPARGLARAAPTAGSCSTSCSPQRLEPESDPLWLGGVVHAALERLYRDAPGADAIPRPATTSGAGAAPVRELLDEEVGRGAAGAPSGSAHGRAHAGCRSSASCEREADSETALRPRTGPAGARVRDRGRAERRGRARPGRVQPARQDRPHRRRPRRRAAPGPRLQDAAEGDPAARSSRRRESSSCSSTCWSRRRDLGARADRRPLPARSAPTSRRTAAARPRAQGRRAPRRPEPRQDRPPGRRRASRRSSTARAEARDRAGRASCEPARSTAARCGGSLPEYCTYQPICRLERARSAAPCRGGRTATTSDRDAAPPTPEQAAAIEARDRDVFLEAGAGTGKTRVLVERYCDGRVRGRRRGREILAFTFTERAAAELRERIRERARRSGRAPPGGR